MVGSQEILKDLNTKSSQSFNETQQKANSEPSQNFNNKQCILDSIRSLRQLNHTISTIQNQNNSGFLSDSFNQQKNLQLQNDSEMNSEGQQQNQSLNEPKNAIGKEFLPNNYQHCSENLNEQFNALSLSSIDLNTKQELSIDGGSLSVSLNKEEIEGSKVLLELRSYQREIYKNSIQQNSIIYLETGTGKTFITVCLMLHYLVQNPKKKVVFLANTIQLVEQQGKEILKKLRSAAKVVQKELRTNQPIHTDKIAIKIIHGDKQPDFFNKTKWQVIVECTDIFVMTSQVYLNGLRQGLLQMGDFSCVVLDECHHAQASHPFSLILSEFYFFFKEKKLDVPIIVGTTASPLNEPKKSDKDSVLQVIKLCLNLDCNFSKFDYSKVQNYVHDSNHRVLNFSHNINCDQMPIKNINQINTQSVDQEYLFDELKDKFPEYYQIIQKYKKFQLQKISLQPSQFLIDQLISLKKYLVDFSIRTLLELGKYSLGLLIEEVTKQIQNPQFSGLNSNPIDKQIYQDLQVFMDKANDIIKPYKICQKYNFSEKFNVFLNEIEKEINNSTGKSISILTFCTERMTAKFMSLQIENYIQETGTGGLQQHHIMGHNGQNQAGPAVSDNIIFVQKKEDLQEKYQEIIEEEQRQFQLKQIQERQKKFIHRKPKLIQIDFTYKQQVEVIEKFRQKKFNLLISTKVSEEGFDIPQCNMVIAYNGVDSFRSYIQMKGRARQKDSQFVILTEKSQHYQIDLDLKTYERTKTGLRQITNRLNQHPMEYLKQIYQKEYPYEIVPYYKCFFIERTGAMLTSNWADNLLQSFCQSLDSSPTYTTKPSFTILNVESNSSFLAIVHLPYIVTHCVNEFHDEEIKKKDEAKKSACFKAVKNLIKMGYIDQNLKPRHQKSYDFTRLDYESNMNIQNFAAEKNQKLKDIEKKYCMEFLYQFQDQTRIFKFYKQPYFKTFVSLDRKSKYNLYKIEFSYQLIQEQYNNNDNNNNDRSQFGLLIHSQVLDGVKIGNDYSLHLIQKDIEYLSYNQIGQIHDLNVKMLQSQYKFEYCGNDYYSENSSFKIILDPLNFKKEYTCKMQIPEKDILVPMITFIDEYNQINFKEIEDSLQNIKNLDNKANGEVNLDINNKDISCLQEDSIYLEDEGWGDILNDVLKDEEQEVSEEQKKITKQIKDIKLDKKNRFNYYFSDQVQTQIQNINQGQQKVYKYLLMDKFKHKLNILYKNKENLQENEQKQNIEIVFKTTPYHQIYINHSKLLEKNSINDEEEFEDSDEGEIDEEILDNILDLDSDQDINTNNNQNNNINNNKNSKINNSINNNTEIQNEDNFFNFSEMSYEQLIKVATIESNQIDSLIGNSVIRFIFSMIIMGKYNQNTLVQTLRNELASMRNPIFLVNKFLEKFKIFKYMLHSEEKKQSMKISNEGNFLGFGVTIDRLITDEQRCLEDMIYKKKQFLPYNYVKIEYLQILRVFQKLMTSIYENNNNLDEVLKFLNILSISEIQSLKIPVKFEIEDQNSFENGIKLKNQSFYNKLDQLQQDMSYKFKNLPILIQAMTDISYKIHFDSSFVNNEYKKQQTNTEMSQTLNSIDQLHFSFERLVFIGDPFLKFVILKFLKTNKEKIDINIRKDQQCMQDMMDSGEFDYYFIYKCICNKHTLSLFAAMFKLGEIVQIYENTEVNQKFIKKLKKFSQYYHQNQDNIEKLFKESYIDKIQFMGNLFLGLVGSILIDTNLDYVQSEEIVLSMIGPKLLSLCVFQNLIQNNRFKLMIALKQQEGKNLRYYKLKDKQIKNYKKPGINTYIFINQEHEDVLLDNIEARTTKEAWQQIYEHYGVVQPKQNKKQNGENDTDMEVESYSDLI